MAKTKTIYRDKATNRLITPKQAENRDPDSYTIEEFVRPDPGHDDLAEEEHDEEEQQIVVAA